MAIYCLAQANSIDFAKTVLLPLEYSMSAIGAILVLWDENSTIKMPFSVRELVKMNSKYTTFIFNLHFM